MARQSILGIFLLFVCVVSGLSEIRGEEPGAGSAPPETPSAGPAPAVVVPITTHNYGVVDEGAVVEFAFPIKNSGPGVLKIEKLHPSCGCTAVVADSELVQPGAETAIRASFNTGGFSGREIKTVRVYTNDPKKSSFLLTLEGEVKTEIYVEPPRVYFGRVRKGETKSMTVTVVGNEAQGIELGEISSRGRELEVLSEPLPEGEKRGKKVTIKLSASVPVGILRKTVYVKTTSSKYPVVSIPVFARVVGDLELVPQNLSFGLIKAPLAEDVSAKLELRSIAAQPVHITSITSSLSSFEAKVNPLEEGERYEIIVSLKAGALGVLRGKVDIETDHPEEDQRYVSFPVYAIVSEKGE